MKINRTAALACLLTLLGSPAAFPLKPVENSSEDLFWTEPMTSHDFKKNTDLHTMAVSAMALTELEFVRIGDGLLSLSLRNKKSPLSDSLDSLEYAYAKLPRIEPVNRLGQFFDALQLRQVSLSDARLVGAVLMGDSMGGITPLMQTRAYKLVVWLEDVIYDIDKTVMYPLNWGIASVRDEPSHLKSLGFAADGLGLVRWEFFSGLKWISREVVRFSSDVVHAIEKPYDKWIRHKRKKQNAHVLIYSKMPLTVFKENLSYLKGMKKMAFAGTVPEWQARLLLDPGLLPDKVRPAELPFLETPPMPSSPEQVIVAAEYTTWEKVPRELKKYVITSDEVLELVSP